MIRQHYSGSRRAPIRIGYLSGPVGAKEVYRSWKVGRQEDFFGTVYLKQYFEVCREFGAEGYVVTTQSGMCTREQVGDFIFENRPQPAGMRGLSYHLAMSLWILRLIPSLFRFGPDVLIVTAFANYWFLLAILRWRGTVILPALHCALWPKLGKFPRSWRVLMGLNRILLFNRVDVAIAVSDDAADQLRSLVPRIDVQVFNATYPRHQFESFEGPNCKTAPPFRIFFAGRVETNKGIFDLLEVADQLERKRPGAFHFDVCGDGSELDRFQAEVERRGLAGVVSSHGWCGMQTVADLLGRSHCVIIPTTTQFEEGFPKVYAEAILSSRPVITSGVCITKRFVRPAAIEVAPNDVAGYSAAIERLCDDPVLYSEKVRSCREIQDHFYDPRNSWGARLREALDRCLPSARGDMT